MEQIGEILQQKKFEIKKPRKDDEKLRLRARLSELTGRTPKSIWASTMIFTEDMLEQAVRYTEPYSKIKARNYFFNEFLELTKK